MKSILNKLKINFLTYYFFILCFMCGYIKNVLIIFMIIVIHEFGHVITIILLKYDIESINIYPFGGITKINKPINSKIIHDILIAVSGVLFQYIIVNIICIFNIFEYQTVYIIKSYNIILIVFNLFPIVPLDGSKLFESILNMFFSYKKSFHITFIISVLSIILFINYNMINSLNNYLIIALLIFYTYRYYIDFKYIFNKFLLERVLYKFSYKKIKNNTKNIDDLRREYKHYFKGKNKYVSEEEKIKDKFGKIV